MTSKLDFSENIDDILKNFDYSKLQGKVGLKLHFGEKGCDTYLDPKIAKKVYKAIEQRGYDVTMIECNVLYKGSRTNASDHLQTAREHGFDFGQIDILDGENGDQYMTLDMEKGQIDKARIGKGLDTYDSLLVLSHFKGHEASGFGGAFKNIGMGLGSRSGKLHMHSDISPSVIDSKCIGCEKCMKGCDFDAIHMEDGTAHIDKEKCIGCAMCIAICPHGAVQIPWSGSSKSDLQKKIIDYSKAIIDYMDDNIVYINVLENITKACDCMGQPQTPITDDIGILSGTDPVAIDKASFDLLKEKTDGKFQNLHDIDGSTQLDYGAELGLGSMEYEIG